MTESFTRTTIQDIARKLNITASTVSRALNDHPAISIATKKAVTKTAVKLDYHHNRIASSLRLGKTKILGVIIPSAEINFFGSVVHGIEKVASAMGYNVLMYQSNELLDYEIKGVETFLRSRVDGVLASISKETTNLDHYRKIKSKGVPLILFDRASDDLGVPSVTINDYQGAFEATCHLIEQGCTSIAHIAGQQHVAIFKQRLKGYIDALRLNNMEVSEELIVYGKVTIDSGRECMNHLLQSNRSADGIFAVEDFTALGVMQSIKASGKKIPEDVCVIGFANEAFGEFISPSLSTVDQQTIKMGVEAAHLFFELSAKNNFYEGDIIRKVLDPVLLFRKSSLRKRP
jgi:LacI family transcriptional regulator